MTQNDPPSKNHMTDPAVQERIARLAHDIRTPLNVISGLSSIMQRDSYTPQKKMEFLKALEASSQKLTRAMQELLDIVQNPQDPLAFTPSPPPHDPDPPPPLAQEPRKTGRILVVEDFDGNMLVATSCLKLFGYSYDTVCNGREALEKIKDNRYDTILMDIQMPEMDGFEATAAIRRMEREGRLPHIPIVGMTAYASDRTREQCMALGMDGYISKPFRPHELKSVLGQYTG